MKGTKAENLGAVHTHTHTHNGFIKNLREEKTNRSIIETKSSMKFCRAKNERGITLLALIVTIIVLIIIAGVAIAMISGNNGIFKKAGEGATKNALGAAQDMCVVKASEMVTNYMYERHVNVANKTDVSYNADTLDESIVDEICGNNSSFTAELNGLGVTATKNSSKTFTLQYKSVGKIDGTLDNGKITWSGYQYSGTGEFEEVAQPTPTPTVTTYTVSFYKESTDTTPYATKTVNENETIGTENMPENPTKAEDSTYTYTFSKWKVGANEFTGSTQITGNTSVYAEWTQVAKANPTDTPGTANSAYTGDFGKKVSGYNPTSGSNWRLFYADSNYAYLISDSIGNYALNNTSVVTGWGTSTMTDLGKNLNPKFTSWTAQSGNNNIKAVAALTDSSQWLDYKTSDAEWAIGAPPVEMFINSYNATHTTQLGCRVESTSSTGYQVNINGGDYETYFVKGLGNSSDLDNAIYCPSSGYWWLASPCEGSGGDYVKCMSCAENGRLSYDYYGNAYGVRPLVCIPLSKIGTGTGQISITNSY